MIIYIMSKKKKHREKLDEFLQKYKTKEGEESTHLRIPNVNLGVYGGKWCIKGKEALKKFSNSSWTLGILVDPPTSTISSICPLSSLASRNAFSTGTMHPLNKSSHRD